MHAAMHAHMYDYGKMVSDNSVTISRHGQVLSVGLVSYDHSGKITKA